jgi:hypothetical protein
MTTPTLSILMCALKQRAKLRPRIEEPLRAQAAAAGPGATELLIAEDEGLTPSGTKRGNLAAQASGRYVVFVDDDDRVAPQYLERLLTAAESDPPPGLITFDLLRTDRQQRWIFRLQYGDRTVIRDGAGRREFNVIWMVPNHLCAWPRDVARRVPWLPIWYCDDVAWYTIAHAAGLARAEHHIPEVLYYYDFTWSTTANQRRERVAYTRQYTAGGLDAYYLADQIVTSAIPRFRRPANQPELLIRHCDGSLQTVAAASLQHICLLDPTGTRPCNHPAPSPSFRSRSQPNATRGGAPTVPNSYPTDRRRAT